MLSVFEEGIGKMKRAFSTVACMGNSYEELAACAGRAHMDAIEICMDDNGRICGTEKEALPKLVQAFAEQGEAPETTWELLQGKIAHVHLKDGVKNADPDWIDYTYTRLGEGELTIKEIVALLQEKGYTGYLSLEWEKQWRSEIRDEYESLDELLHDYNELLDE